MNKHTLIAAVLTTFVFSASPALADKDKKGGPPAHAKSKADQGLHLGWYKQQWKRGDRIVWAEVEPRYYVTDYRVYRLSPPPEGYRWVRPMDDRYLLVEVATGLIVQALGY